MQKIYFLVLLMTSLGTGYGQSPAAAAMAATSPTNGPAILTEGKVIYQRKIDIYRRLTDESVKAMMPQFDSSKTELDFSGDESIYKNLKEDADIRDKAGEDNNNRFVVKMGGGDDQTYKNRAAGKMVQQKELGPKKYIIEDTLPTQNWHLEEATRTIKGYTCKKASTKSKAGLDVTAWYAEDVRAFSGPEGFGGLPGLILELNINDGEIVFSALDILTRDFDKRMVKAPTDGKKISSAEYRKMMEDQYGEGPGGGVKIRIIHNN
jgi:GLPGLI family protein